MAKNEVYNILYIEQDIEAVTQLKRIIREHSVNSKYLINVVSMDQFESAKQFIENETCDLILLKDSPKLPSFKQVNDVVGLKDFPILMIVDEKDLIEKQSFIAEGAVGVSALNQSAVLFQLIVRAIYTKKTQIGYRNILEKNQELTEITSKFLKDTNDLIAYFDPDAGTFLYANDAFLTRFNFHSIDDLLINTVLDFVDSQYSAPFKKMMKIVSKTGNEQEGDMAFIDFSSKEKIEKHFSLKKALYEEMPCLELFFSAGNTNQGSSENATNQTIIAERSDAEMLYNRLAFFDTLPNYIGSSSWLVCLVMQDYFSIRKKHGVETLENYFSKVAKLLKSQIKGLHLVRYSDESFVLLMPNSDMASVDRIGMAITSTATNFHYKDNEINISSSFRFVYASLGDEVDQISSALNSIDSQSGLLQSRVTAESEAQYESSKEQEPVDESAMVESEFIPLQTVLKNQSLELIFEPVVDFSMAKEGLYSASYNLLDENNKIIFWNKSFTHTANNDVVKQLDIFLIQQVLSNLSKEENKHKKVIIPLSMYFLSREEEFIQLLQSIDQSGLLKNNVVFGFSEEAVDLNLEVATQFFNMLKMKGIKGHIYDVADISETNANSVDVTIIALSENCVSRLSRGMSADETKQFSAFLKGAKDKQIRVLAKGVNSAAMMAMVWEYTIPLASGSMVGVAGKEMDFDFSQVVM